MPKQQSVTVELPITMVARIINKDEDVTVHTDREAHAARLRELCDELRRPRLIPKGVLRTIEALVYRAYCLGLCDTVEEEQTLEEYKREIRSLGNLKEGGGV